MWLIHCSSKVLVDAASENWPDYAILSHVWSRDKTRLEVSFQNMQDPQKASEMPGFLKIRQTCQRALDDGYQYAWIDTCCIDKQNSTELSEAINSMFRWYREAAVCYGLLSDVESESHGGSDGASLDWPYVSLENQVWNELKMPVIHNSEWFDRGWTLQELLAPKHVVFFDLHWEELGTKVTLLPTIVSKTGIPEEVLNSSRDLFSMSIAQRMSWASDRKTTRLEDRAYSLLGIFDINMPLLYGEGEKAFIRLQEEIIRRSDDQSLFAWRHVWWNSSSVIPTENRSHDLDVPQRSIRALHGMLASTPEAFRECRHVRKTNSRERRPPYAMSNRGLSISFKAVLWSIDTYVVPLYCDDKTMVGNDEFYNTCLALILTRLYEDDQYARTTTEDGESLIRMDRRLWDNSSPNARHLTFEIAINVPQRIDNSRFISSSGEINPIWGLQKRHLSGFRLKQPQLFKLVSPYNARWNDEDKTIEIGSSWGYGRGITLEVLLAHPECPIGQLKVAFDIDCNPVCFVLPKDETGELEEGLKQRYEEEQVAFLGANSQNRLDPSIWKKAWQRAPHSDELWELKLLRHRLLALRGDRFHGIAVNLWDQPSTDPERRILSSLRMRKVEIKQGERTGCIVWELSLDYGENDGDLYLFDELTS